MSSDNDATISIGKLAQGIAVVGLGAGLGWLGSQTIQNGKDIVALQGLTMRQQHDVETLQRQMDSLIIRGPTNR